MEKKKKKFIKEVMKSPAAPKKAMGVKDDEKVPAKKMAKVAEAPGKMSKKEQLIENLKNLSKGKGKKGK